MKKVIIILIITILVVILGVLVFTLWSRLGNKKFDNTNHVDQNLNLNTNFNVSVNTNVSEPKELTVEQIALIFAERYGSYSNQSNLQNLESLKPWMSQALWKKTEQLIASEKAKSSAVSEYQSFTTKGLVVKVLNSSSNKASVLVATQRTESKENQQRTYYQDIILDFVKENNQWKVDQATWQPESK